MSIRRSPLRFALVLLAACGACKADDASICDREPLTCDAIYLPYVRLVVTDAETGDPYCGRLTVSYVSRECGVSDSTVCDCSAGELRGTGYFEHSPCHVNPPPGETSDLTVTVDGYRTFTAPVTLAWQCHPQLDLPVELQRPAP